MHHCAGCGGALEVQRMACADCGLAFEGRFHLPRLARLAAEQQALGEQILLAGGNLKAVAEELEVSYPTLRKRVDALQASLRELALEDRERIDALLSAVETGGVRPEEAARLIKELRGGA